MRAAAIQLVVGDDRVENIDRASALVRAAAEEGAKLVLLPELFSVPFVQPTPDPDYFRWAETADGPSNAAMSRLSEELDITIVSSIFEERRVPGTYANAAHTFVSGRRVAVYDKSHLPFSNGFPEKFYFTPGAAAPFASDTHVGRVGTVICYERHFPELARAVALDGAIALCVPVASSSAPMREVFQLELRAHAVANGMYVVCANRSGLEGDKDYFGTSAIYDPDGAVVAQIDDGDGYAIAEVDEDRVRTTRQRRPFLRDRRPELYAD
jgi:beta-ureidopropionase